MKVFLLSILICSISISAFANSNSGIEFIQNNGQWNDSVVFRADIGGGSIWQQKNAFIFDFHSQVDLENAHQYHHSSIAGEIDTLKIHSQAFEMRFLNANPLCELRGMDQKSNYNNYFIGNDSSRWASNVPVYEASMTKNLYNNIDLKLYTFNGHLKYDFIVQPGGNINEIKFKNEGCNIDLVNNELVMILGIGNVIIKEPIAYQIKDGRKVEVKCDYILSKNEISFQIGDEYDSSIPLIIDPELIFSSYSGSLTDNYGYTATYDDEGNLYAGGIVFNFGYPITLGSYQTLFMGIQDITISKFSYDGTNLLYSTYIGGDYNEEPHSLMVDNLGNLCFMGASVSSDFPTTLNSYCDTLSGGYDIIIGKLNSSGSQLIASTYIGGSNYDGYTYGSYGYFYFNYADNSRGELIVDSDNSIYIASYSQSPNFPTSEFSEQQTLNGDIDGVAVHISSNLDSLLFSTFIGGSDGDVLFSIKKKDDLIVLGGGSNSVDFPTTDGALHESIIDSIAGVVLTLNENGAIINSTFLGAGNSSIVYLIDIGPEGHIYALGYASGNYPVTDNVYSNPYSQQFIQELDINLTSSIQSTTFGSSDSLNNHFSPTAFMVDDCGLIYASGHISMNTFWPPDYNFPTTSNALQDTTDGRDFYFIVFNKDFKSLLMATYFGEFGNIDHVDGGTSRFNKDGVIYQAICASCDGTSGFPTTPGAWSESNGSVHCNLVALKIDMEAQDVNASLLVNDTLVCGGTAPFEIQFENNGRSAPFNFWDFGDGLTSNEEDPTHFYDEPGNYTVQHILIDSTTCISSDTAFATFNISFVEDFIMDWTVSPPLYCKDTLYVALEFSGQSADSLIWDMGDGTIYYQNPVFYQYDEAGNYEVSLQAFNFECDNEGFLNTEFLLEENLVSSKVAVPNIFSPNGDGRNDYFQLYYLSKPNDDPLFYIEELSMKIYNRWGRLVYKSDSNPNSWRWDGRSDNIEVSEGVYYYIIEYSSLCEGGGIEKFAGDVTLVRQRRR